MQHTEFGHDAALVLEIAGAQVITRCEFVMVQVRRSPKVMARIRERAGKGLCLAPNDDGSDCDCKAENNGNCPKHDQRARREEARLVTITARKAFRDELIRKGWRLMPYESRYYKTKDRFSQIATELS